jgi:alanyl-tRNA synthetase
MYWTVDRIRQSFLDFFAREHHTVVPSASLIPQGDPTLLFTNAGMVQFKDYFLGVRKPPWSRVADCQKCLRISGKHNDLDAVGRDDYHHTFFEMLGNWSFGDYYKAEAIEFHWRLITQEWKLPTERLWATVYSEDDEAAQAWVKLNVLPRERILRFGEEDNFWEMGDAGPCGPCSEIHFDRGEGACAGKGHPGHRCAVNLGACSRFIELANLVFIQYDRDRSGKLTPLPTKHVDTGAGLERIAAVMQSLEAGRILGNYDTDLFRKIIEAIEKLNQELTAQRHRYRHSDDRWPANLQARVDVAFRAIADHIRAITFLIADGITPGNTEREYVLRRLIRRAACQGWYLGFHQPFLSEISKAVVQAMGDAYPELKERHQNIRDVIRLEEDRFAETLTRGLDLLNSERTKLQEQGLPVFSGELAFKLYDTYGFPLDLTEDILRDEGIKVDVAEFERLMEEQRARSRAATRAQERAAPEILLHTGAGSRFIGYDRYQAESEIVRCYPVNGSLALLVAETPFYPEGGGQVGDQGVIETQDGAAQFAVTDTRKQGGLILHIGRLVRGAVEDLSPGKPVKLSIDGARREAAMLNHSATHILHAVLRERLGKNVRQAGSLVAPDRLRFDFSYPGQVKEEELYKIEQEVNAHIREDAGVTTAEMAYDDAIRAGALAFFGDKYGDRVRVVRIGDFSLELCGGTHVERTGEIGLFKLEGESGVGAGVRRVEALTGQGALDAVHEREKILEQIGRALRAGAGEAAITRLERLLAREKELEKRVRALEQKLLTDAGAKDGDSEMREIHGIRVITRELEGVEPPAMRQLADRLRERYGSVVVALASKLNDKVALVVAVTPDLSARVKAGEIIRQIAPIVGGSGGGRSDFAQAGGRLPEKAAQALKQVYTLLA